MEKVGCITKRNKTAEKIKKLFNNLLTDDLQNRKSVIELIFGTKCNNCSTQERGSSNRERCLVVSFQKLMLNI